MKDLKTNGLEESSILGLPPKFSARTDPNQRVFSELIFDNPPIAMFVPGRPDFDRLQKLDNGTVNKLRDTIKAEIDGKDISSNLQDIYKKLNDRAAEFDQRYFTFKPDPRQFMDIYNPMVSRVASRMSDVSVFTNSGIDLKGWGGFNVYLDKASSITESGSNEYGSSVFEGLTDKLGDFVKEAKFFGAGAFRSDSASEDSARQERTSRMNTQIDDIVDGRSAFGKAGIAFSGNKILFPQMWKNSSFTRNYSLACRFETPYGDKESIFREVYRPFLALLAMSLPVQDTAMGYGEPMLLRIDSPGWFTIDCGIITDISIERGVDENDWTNTGLARSIKVNLSVTDIYPALMLSSSTAALSTNFGLAMYLDSMAGLSYAQMGQYSTLKETMMGWLSNAYLNTVSIPDVAAAKIDRVFDDVLATITFSNR